jgi:hypothetical protein
MKILLRLIFFGAIGVEAFSVNKNCFPSTNSRQSLHARAVEELTLLTSSKPHVKTSLRMISESSNSIDPMNLMDMDIMIFSKKSEPGSMQLGAIQEDGTLAPLSAWTSESAFGDSIEFLVDEEDRWMDELDLGKVNVLSVLGEDLISYGSRQVGGGKGPGNPHGEESEQLYYIDRKVIDDHAINIVLKPQLEILW